ncbi:MAG: NADH-quinone oxidoreductase subunit J [Bacteroidales bacterium]|jgi:NADH-quinone oxidoreductase subunit J|nr:NADH-quinone oxidoreductase subunit J [Bacteroidales bacterium]OJX88041.1 MAG: NADH dehydrogenase [Paludibacter sp. 47-17]
MAQQVVFIILSLVIAFFSVMAVNSKHVIRSTVYLLFVFLATAGLYLLLGYYYLFGVQVAVYAGGIMILFIFAIFLTNKPIDYETTKLPVSKIIAALTAVGGIALSAHVVYYNIRRVATLGPIADLNPQQLGHVMLGTEKYNYLLAFETLSVLLLACVVGAITVARKR